MGFPRFLLAYFLKVNEPQRHLCSGILHKRHSHQQPLRDKKKWYQSSTALSKHVWSLKENNTGFKIMISWEVQKKATEYQNTTARRNLRVAEKLAIIRADKKTSLNKRSELVSKCRHKNRHYLSSFPPPIKACNWPDFTPTYHQITVSSKSHISFSTISTHLHFFVSLAPHLFVAFPGFSPRFPTLPHTPSSQPALPHPLPSLFIQGLVSFDCIFAWRSALPWPTLSCKTHKKCPLDFVKRPRSHLRQKCNFGPAVMPYAYCRQNVMGNSRTDSSEDQFYIYTCACHFWSINWSLQNVQCIQKFFSQTLFDFKRMVSHSISPKFSGKIPYVLSKPRICFLGSKDKTVLFKQV